MSISNQSSSQTLNQVVPQQQINGALLEKVILQNDLAGLSSIEKVQYVKNVCQTLGLNPVTKPIQLIKFQGQEKPYFTKDATEQLRKINNVSITKIETKVHDASLYVVTVYAVLPDGRQDSSTGAIVIAGLKGDALANAMMKAETKAKRRVTLSICGLGFIDESEAESIPYAKKVDISPVETIKPIKPSIDDELLNEVLLTISQLESLGELEIVFTSCYKELVQKHDKEGLRRLIEAKDKKKSELSKLSIEQVNEQTNEETGEVN